MWRGGRGLGWAAATARLHPIRAGSVEKGCGLEPVTSVPFPSALAAFCRVRQGEGSVCVCRGEVLARRLLCLQNLKHQPTLCGYFIPCLPPCCQGNAASVWLGFSSCLIPTASVTNDSKPAWITYLVPEMLHCVLCTSISFSVDSAESGILQWVECSERNRGELTPGQGKTSSMNLPVLPYNQMSARKTSAGPGYLLIGVCVSVCACMLVCLWPVDNWRLSLCLCVFSRGVRTAGLLYHPRGYRLDSTHQYIGDCVMSI